MSLERIDIALALGLLCLRFLRDEVKERACGVEKDCVEEEEEVVVVEEEDVEEVMDGEREGGEKGER